MCRRYATTIRHTVFALFKDILTSWKLYPGYVKIRESDFNIQFPNGSEIIFSGLDEEQKLLSLVNIGTIFVEEATEINLDFAEQLNIRLRGKTQNQQLFMAFNPISKNNWLYNFCEVEPPANMLYLQSTFKDNPFLPKENVMALEELITRNPRKAEVFVFNRWGSDVDGLVFQNWHVEQFNFMALAAQPQVERRAGLDIGFTDPTAIVDSLYDKDNHTIYVYNEFYKSGQTLEQILTALGNMNLRKTRVYCDSADPRAIDYFRRNGCSTYPCIKGQGSVDARISFLQNNRIIILPKCENVINEFENFSYIKDKKTGNLTDKTTHEFSHSIDALGYAYSDIYTNNKLRSFDKKLLSIR